MLVKSTDGKDVSVTRLGQGVYNTVGASAGIAALLGAGNGGLLGGIFGNIFGGSNGGRRRSPDAPNQGASLRYDLEISFKEAVYGTEKQVQFQHTEPCESCQGTGGANGAQRKTCGTCGGSGQVRRNTGFFAFAQTCPTCGGDGSIIDNPCKVCGGSGLQPKRKKINIQIPAGADNGKRITIPRQGDAGRNGGPAGDLIISVTVKPHAMFERDGSDIYCEVPINYWEAALGDDIEIPTLEGKEKFHIPDGTQTGTTFTLRGRGIQRVNSSMRGNLYITVKVEVPKSLSSKQKELLKDLAESFGDKIEKGRESFFKKFTDILK